MSCSCIHTEYVVGQPEVGIPNTEIFGIKNYLPNTQKLVCWEILRSALELDLLKKYIELSYVIKGKEL